MFRCVKCDIDYSGINKHTDAHVCAVWQLVGQVCQCVVGVYSARECTHYGSKCEMSHLLAPLLPSPVPLPSPTLLLLPLPPSSSSSLTPFLLPFPTPGVQVEMLSQEALEFLASQPLDDITATSAGNLMTTVDEHLSKLQPQLAKNLRKMAKALPGRYFNTMGKRTAKKYASPFMRA